MIRPKFKMKDVEAHIQKRLAELDRKTIARLQVLGEMCVNMARGEGNNDPSGFPVTYTKSENPQPLKQRQITQRDIDRSPTVKQPKFGDFVTWTGNLINSISYFIIRNGQIIDYNIGSEETETARNIANQRAKKIKKGYGLVVVAGSRYAARIETLGYDVLTSSELFAEKEFPKLLKQLAKDRE